MGCGASTPAADHSGVVGKGPSVKSVATPAPSANGAFNCSSEGCPVEHVVKIAVSGKNLAVAETSGYQPPDPFAVLCVTDARGAWEETSRTEVLENNRDPDFDRALACMFVFERPQRLKVVVHSRNKFGGRAKSEDNLLGEAEFTLRELVTARGNRLQLPLHQGAQNATITLNVLDSSALNSELVCRIVLERVPILANAKIFVRAVREAANGAAPQPVMQTQAIGAGAAQQRGWSVRAGVRALCEGDFRAPLRLEVWEAAAGRCTLAGAASTNLRALQSDALLPLTKDGHDAGCLALEGLAVRRRPSFLDYMAGSCEINFMCAIDFSAGNLPPGNPGSGHYAGPDGQSSSPYERMMAALGAVLQFYDPLRSFPLWGFGGQSKGCWALNGQQFQPEVKGLRGLLRTYKKALTRAEMGSPALLAPTIHAARDLVEQLSLVQHRYFLLVVLTAGCGEDLEEFGEALRAAGADLALSVAVIGIGNADFSPLEAVIQGAVHANGHSPGGNMGGKLGSLAGRQMALFAQIRGSNYDEVAAQVLAQVPLQFEQFFQKRGLPKTFSNDSALATELRARSKEL